MLDAAHRGYEYQDLLTAARLTDMVLGRVVKAYVDEKLFPTDLFDDLTVHESDGRRERFQIKHASADAVPLPLATFTSDTRNLKLDDLVASIIADREGPGGGASTLYRVVTRNTAPTDADLARVLRPCRSDPGPVLPGVSSKRLEFDVAALWPTSPTSDATSSDTFAFLRNGTVDREQVLWACGHLVVEVEAPAASFDLTTPGPAEEILLNRVRRDVGAETYPNAHRTASDVASAFVAVARGARQRTAVASADELIRRARLRTDFGAVARSHPVNTAIAVSRAEAVRGIVDRVENAADAGVPLILVGPPGQGKSWCCQQVVESLIQGGWLVAEHYCYLGQADSERQTRVLGEAMFGSLLSRLAEAEPALVAQQRPRFSSGARELTEALEESRRKHPERGVALIVDGLDHVSRVVGAVAGRTEPSRLIADELAALAIPCGCILVVLSQPGDHLTPIVELNAEIVDAPSLGIDELSLLAERLGVVGPRSAKTGDSAGPVPFIDPSEKEIVAAFQEALQKRSKGNALYATYLCREVQRQAVAPLDPAGTIYSLPAFDGSLEGYYRYLVSTLDGGAVVADLLAVIDFPVTRAELREIQPATGHRVEAALDRLAPVLVEQAGQAGVRIYHESFARFLCRAFSGDEAVNAALLGAIIEWLKVKGLFSESRAFRFLLPTLARARRDSEVVGLIGVDFTVRAIAAGFTASAISANLTVGTGSAVRIGDWPAVIRCIELSRAAVTFEEDSISDPLVRFLDVPLSVLTPEVFAERLLYDGRTTLQARLGLELCAAADEAGASAPWVEYMDAFLVERDTDNTSYGEDAERRVGMAYLRGRLRVDADSVAGLDEASIRRAGAATSQLSPERVAKWLRGKGLPPTAVIDAICDTVGAEFAEETLGRLDGPPDLILALAERLAGPKSGRSDAALARCRSAAIRKPLSGSADRLLALGVTLAELGHLNPPSRERLFALTREVQAERIQFAPTPLLAWLDQCTAFARADLLGLASAEALISGEGWYRCWLRFVIALCRAEAALSEAQSAGALEALRVLSEDLSPFAGTPRACDLWGLEEIIVPTYRRALGLLTEEDWPHGLESLRVVSDGITTMIQGVFGGPLTPSTLLALASERVTPARRSAVDAIVAHVRARNADRRLYAYLGESHLAGARAALASGDREEASKNWMDACSLMAAYGWHKDITIYEVLEPLSSLITADPERAREALEVLQPLCWRVAQHTDGKETRHAPGQWWRLLSAADPWAVAEMITPELLRNCNMPQSRLEDARLDLWRVNWGRADPFVAGALRLSLTPGLDKNDPDALARLGEYSRQNPSTRSDELVRLLLARVDERRTDYGVSNQDELLARDAARVEDINRLADAIDGPRIAPFPNAGRMGERVSGTSGRGGQERIGAADVLKARTVEPFGQGPAGIGKVIREWRTRPFQATGWKWESDRFVNAIGFRLLDLADKAQAVEAEAVLAAVAAEQRFGDEGGLLAGLGAGLEARGHVRLAAMAFAFAWTKTRGGGGWVNFGGETSLDLLRRAARLNGEAALKTIGDEARRVAAGGGLGVCQALVHAFAKIDFGVSAGRTSATSWTETAFACWNEAAKVIAFRTPAVGAADDPRVRYRAHQRRSIGSARVPSSAEGERGEGARTNGDDPARTEQVNLDRALALATVGGLAHPGREQKRRSLVGIRLLLEERTELAADACLVGLENLSDPLTLTWLLRVIETCPSGLGKVVERCGSVLRRIAQGGHLTVRALAARLLAKVEDAVGAPPPSETEKSVLRGDKRRAAGIVAELAGDRLWNAKDLFPGLEEVVRDRVAAKIDTEDARARWEVQSRALRSPNDSHIPDAIVWLVEIVEDALQLAAAEGRARLAERGKLVADSVQWEDDLAEQLLNDPWLPLGLERCREPRPVNLPSRGEMNGTMRMEKCDSAPVVGRGPRAGWRVVASVEWSIVPSTWERSIESISVVYCGIEFRAPGDGAGLEHPPLHYGDANLWRSFLDPEFFGDIPFRTGPLVGLDMDGRGGKDAAKGLGLSESALVPVPWLVVSLRLRPGDEPLVLVDDAGPAMALRTWRSRYVGGEGELQRPLVSGTQLLIRDDLLERLVARCGGEIVWREFNSRSSESDADDVEEEEGGAG